MNLLKNDEIKQDVRDIPKESFGILQEIKGSPKEISGIIKQTKGILTERKSQGKPLESYRKSEEILRT